MYRDDTIGNNFQIGSLSNCFVIGNKGVSDSYGGIMKIDQEQDLLTPLLVVQFLRIVKEIVRKGLKKSYYKVAQNLYGKVKGKILVAQTIKQNVLKNKALNTVCS